MAKISKAVAEILAKVPESKRKKVLNAAHELAAQRKAMKDRYSKATPAPKS